MKTKKYVAGLVWSNPKGNVTELYADTIEELIENVVHTVQTSTMACEIPPEELELEKVYFKDKGGECDSSHN